MADPKQPGVTDARDNKKQSEEAAKPRKKILTGKATGIDCRTGFAHTDLEEPKRPGEPAKTVSVANRQ